MGQTSRHAIESVPPALPIVASLLLTIEPAHRMRVTIFQISSSNAGALLLGCPFFFLHPSFVSGRESLLRSYATSVVRRPRGSFSV